MKCNEIHWLKIYYKIIPISDILDKFQKSTGITSKSLIYAYVIHNILEKIL